MKTIAKDVICYDAEWVPCVRTGRLLTGLPESASDDDVRAALWKRAGATPEKPRPFLKLALSRVVSISAVHRHENSDGTVALAIRSFPDLASPQAPERVIIGSFLEEVALQGAQLVGFNSQSSDLPLMIQRGIANRSRCPAFGQGPEKTWDDVDYFHRVSEAHIDLAQVFTAGAGYGTAVMPSLNEMAAACQIPGKLDQSGGGVLDLWLRGDYAELTGYNETDACTTYLLWLRTAWFLRRLTPKQRDEEVRTFRNLLHRLAPTKPHLGRFLEVWQSRLGIDADDEMHALGQGVADAAQSKTIVVEANLLPNAAAGGTRARSLICEVKLNLTNLDEAALALRVTHISATAHRFASFCVGRLAQLDDLRHELHLGVKEYVSLPQALETGRPVGVAMQIPPELGD